MPRGCWVFPEGLVSGQFGNLCQVIVLFVDDFWDSEFLSGFLEFLLKLALRVIVVVVVVVEIHGIHLLVSGSGRLPVFYRVEGVVAG